MARKPTTPPETAQKPANSDTAVGKGEPGRLKLAPGWRDATPERSGGALVIIGGRLRPPKGGTDPTAEETGTAIVTAVAAR